MCGIIGYVGDKQASDILIDALTRLEYRGYDSAGICVVDKNLSIKKSDSFVSHLDCLPGTFGIGHTRWATHGEPNKTNAHPHQSGSLAIVHNGIIENADSLKKMLSKKGYTFVSQTDSEVIAHLIHSFYAGNLLIATQKALPLLDGTYGLLVVSEKKEIIAAKKGSPLVIGVGSNSMYVCSDVYGILNYTKKIEYLQDDEVAHIKQDTYTIYKNNTLRDPDVKEVLMDVQDIQKEGFKHFMLKEIYDQPKSLQQSLVGRYKDKIKLTLKVDRKSIRQIRIIACGTSYYAGLVGQHYLESLLSVPVSVDYASEFRYRKPHIHEDDVVIFISQSGETADTLAALSLCEKAQTVGIVNTVGSSIARKVKSGIYIHAGPEIGVASTKAFTGQVMCLWLLAQYLADIRVDGLDQVADLVERTLGLSDQIRSVAQSMSDAVGSLFIGRGMLYPLALEGSLKLKEISYIHAQGFPAGELKHGHIALVDKDVPIIGLVSSSHLFEKTLSNIEEAAARSGKIIIITDVVTERIKKIAHEIILVPSVETNVLPFVYAIPLQLLAYHVADLKGLNVDRPRNLAKSVTVE